MKPKPFKVKRLPKPLTLEQAGVKYGLSVAETVRIIKCLETVVKALVKAQSMKKKPKRKKLPRVPLPLKPGGAHHVKKKDPWRKRKHRKPEEES